MPETAIGFFPDVGGSFFLSRLGPLGVYLGLTGKRLVGSDICHAKLATHYIPAGRLADVKSSLASGKHSPVAINQILNSFVGYMEPYSLLPLLPTITECFGKYEVKEIVEAVMEKTESDNNIVANWARETLHSLQLASPTALYVTMEMLKRAKRLSFASCLKAEYDLVHHFLDNQVPDFVEGVTAKLIAKTNAPVWKPSSLNEIVRSNIDKLFIRSPSQKAPLKLYNAVDFSEYPKDL